MSDSLRGEIAPINFIRGLSSALLWASTFDPTGYYSTSLHLGLYERLGAIKLGLEVIQKVDEGALKEPQIIASAEKHRKILQFASERIGRLESELFRIVCGPQLLRLILFVPTAEVISLKTNLEKHLGEYLVAKEDESPLSYAALKRELAQGSVYLKSPEARKASRQQAQWSAEFDPNTHDEVHDDFVKLFDDLLDSLWIVEEFELNG